MILLIAFMKAYDSLSINSIQILDPIYFDLDSNLLRPLFDQINFKSTRLVSVSIAVPYIHTYHSRFIPEGVPEESQIFLQDLLCHLIV
jgi:hypothetical protein